MRLRCPAYDGTARDPRATFRMMPMTQCAVLPPVDIEIPALPASLVRLSLLLAAAEVDLGAVGDLVENDMALAAAVLKAVNSPLYGLRSAMRSVRHAINYLGLREVAAVTYEAGLRAAFAPTPEAEAVWQRASRRGMLMGRLGQAIGVDAWAAHSAGLFEECGKAVLLRTAPDHYPGMLRAAASDEELVQLEEAAFGKSHAALGAVVCESWGLDSAAVASVRHHVQVHVTGMLPSGSLAWRSVCALSAVVAALIDDVARCRDVVMQVAPQALLDGPQLLLAAQRVHEGLAPR
jgi:HD-like signal output (HDOD) protein